MLEYLEIPVTEKVSGLTLIVYPQSSNAKVFEESEPYAGESRHQLLEGCTYAYELVNRHDGKSYQFETQNEIVKINLGGPKVYGYKEMKDRKYPFSPGEKNEDKIYLVFRLNQKGIEKELQKYEWKPEDIRKLKLTRYGKFDVIGLTELMRVARIK